MTEAPRYASVRDYVQVLRKRRLMILLITLAFGAALYARDKHKTPIYQATAKLQFSDQTINPGLFQAIVPQDVSPDARAAIHATQILSLAVAQRAAKALRKPSSQARGILYSVTTAAEATTNFVDVTAHSTTARGAADIANAFANAARDETAARLSAQYRREADGVERQIKALGHTPATAYNRIVLFNNLQQLRQGAAVVQPAQVVDVATAPSSQASPLTARDTSLGLIAGFTLAVLIAFLRDAVDRRYSGSGAISSEIDLPILGVVRDKALGRAPLPDNGRKSLSESDIESFRMLRTNVDFMRRDKPVKSILVTSALPEEGKSTVAAALAATYAYAGRRTLLLECDLRKPSLAGRLGLSKSPGLTDYLVAGVDPRQVIELLPGSVIHPAGIAPRELASGSTGTGVARAGADDDATGIRFDCIVAGTRSPHPAELLGSERMAGLLTALYGAYDVVVIDASPLLPVADTLGLLPRVDSVALCLRVSQTTRDQARAAKAALDRLPGPSTGLVLTGLRPRDGGDYRDYSYDSSS